MSQSATLGAQSHFNPNQALKRYFTEEGRSIIPILQINACRWIKQHFHGNSWKFVIDLYLQPCFDMLQHVNPTSLLQSCLFWKKLRVQQRKIWEISLTWQKMMLPPRCLWILHWQHMCSGKQGGCTGRVYLHCSGSRLLQSGPLD